MMRPFCDGHIAAAFEARKVADTESHESEVIMQYPPRPPGYPIVFALLQCGIDRRGDFPLITLGLRQKRSASCRDVSDPGIELGVAGELSFRAANLLTIYVTDLY